MLPVEWNENDDRARDWREEIDGLSCNWDDDGRSMVGNNSGDSMPNNLQSRERVVCVDDVA